MKNVNVSRSISYYLRNEDENEYQFTVCEQRKTENGVPVIYLYGENEDEQLEIELPLTEIPFLIKVLNLFVEEEYEGK